MMASALLEQLNSAIDRQQTAIRNHATSFKYNDVRELQESALSVMRLIAEEGDRNLTQEERLNYAALLK